MLLGITPIRISFAGGGTDLPEYYERYGGNVVTSTISKYVHVIINPRHDNSFQAFSSDFQTHHKPTNYDQLEPQSGTEIATSVIKFLKYNSGINLLISSDVPPGSGLGTSGALAVNLLKTFTTLQKENWSNDKIASTAFHIGRNILKWPIGKQDEYATCYGGLNFIQFEKDKVTVNKISLSQNSLNELQKNLLLFFIGRTRNSSIILSSQLENVKQDKEETIKSLHNVQELAVTTYQSLKNGDLTEFGELLHKGWISKKKFTSGVTNEFVDGLYDTAMKNGALGGKLTGAGGGGHLLLYCEPSKQEKLIQRLNDLGLKQVHFELQREGAKVLNTYDFTSN